MKFRKVTLVALSVIVCLCSCKKDNDPAPAPNPQGGDNAVVLRLDLPGADNTRASIEGSVVTGVVPGMNKVDIYLYDKASGLI